MPFIIEWFMVFVSFYEQILKFAERFAQTSLTSFYISVLNTLYIMYIFYVASMLYCLV